MELIGVLKWIKTGVEYKIFLSGDGVYYTDKFQLEPDKVTNKETFFDVRGYYMDKKKWVWIPEEPFEGNV